MVRWIGYICILVGCIGIGWYKSEELKKREHELQELQQIFSALQKEMEYTRIPIGEILKTISCKTSETYRCWLEILSKQCSEKGHQTFEMMWKESMKHLEESRLTREEFADLKQLGGRLQQPEAIALFLERLEYCMQSTRRENETKRKLYKSFGVMAGVFLVILLL